MSTSSKRRARHSELQEKLFAAWDSLRERSQASIVEYNSRRASLLASLDAEATRLKDLLAESARLQGLIERKKLNLEATYVHKTPPYADITQTVEELLGASLGVLGSLGMQPAPEESASEDVVSDLE